MPYQFQPYIEKQILSGHVWGEQTVEELVQSNTEIVQHLDAVNGRLVHIIINDAKLEKIPLSISAVRDALTFTKHQNLGWVVMIGDRDKALKDNAQDFLLMLLAKITRARYIRLKTLEEAITHLRRVDQSINWDAANLDVQAELDKS